MKCYPSFLPIQLDALKEIANIGAAHSATSLSVLIGEKVAMNVPKIVITSLDKAISLVDEADSVSTCVLLPFSGEINGNFIIISKQDEFFRIAEKFINHLEIHQITEEILDSAITEIGNILGSSYINALSELCELTVDVDVPFVCTDLTGALMMESLAHVAFFTNQVLIIDAIITESFNQTNQLFQGHILFLPSLQSYERILSVLEMNYL